MFTADPVTILLSVVVILFLAYVYNKRQDKYKNFPPGPKPWPIIGNMLSVDMKKPHKTFIELSKTYGPVIGVQMGMQKMVALCGYDAVKDALINHAEEFSDRPRAPILNKMQRENGLVFTNGETWKVMRRFALSTLRDYGMGKRTIEDKISEEAEFLVQTIKSHGGKPFNNQTIINAAVANIIVCILLSRRFEYEDPTIQKLMRLVNENVRLLGSPTVRLYNSFPFLVGFLPGGHKKMDENRLQIQNFIRATFTEQRKELDVNDQRNLVDTFLAKQQEGKPESTQYFHDDNLTALVANLFAAGMETTSTTLRWGLLVMMKYPNIQNKVQEEIEKVIGTAQPRLEHRKQMPYTDAVVHEILRYGDIAPGSVPHATSQDVTFRGYFIPKGTTVIPVLSSVLREKSYFEKPYEFYPEHFLDSKGNFKKVDAFIPFSVGKRSCAGETLAKMELFLFFTTLLQHFTFQAPPGAELDLTPALGATNSPLPYEICAIPRT
ncbi:cytochrome P450 2K4-like [Lithobates pipiens]